MRGGAPSARTLTVTLTLTLTLTQAPEAREERMRAVGSSAAERSGRDAISDGRDAISDGPDAISDGPDAISDSSGAERSVYASRVERARSKVLGSGAGWP